MHDHLDIKTETFEVAPSIYEVAAYIEGTDTTLYVSPVLYRTRDDAEAHQKELNGALFAARCGFCKEAADLIEEIDYMDTIRDTKEFDIIAWCSEDCYHESKREDYELARAGL